MALLLCGSRKHNVSMDTLCDVKIQKNVVPEINMDMHGLDSVKMNIPRCSKGFGFTITGCLPVRVGKVQPGSPASQAGLCKDDCIIQINGQNVSRSVTDSVAKLIRSCDTVLELVVYRNILPSRCSTPLIPTTQPQQTHIPLTRFLDDKENIPSLRNPTYDNNPYMVMASNKQAMQPPIGYSAEMQCMPDRSFRMSQNVSSLAMTYTELSKEEQLRQGAIADLRESLEKLISQLNFGLQHYCLPLEKGIISPADHKILFQNIKQITFFAQSLLQSMMEQAIPFSDFPSHDFLDNVSSLYLPFLPDICNAIGDYCAGAKSAIRLLMVLKKQTDLAQYFQQNTIQSGEISIGTYLQKPIEWIKDSMVHLQNVFSNTEPDHHDYDQLRTVIEGLRHTCNKMTLSHSRHCMSTFSLVSAPSVLSLSSSDSDQSNKSINSPASLQESNNSDNSKISTHSTHSNASSKSNKVQNQRMHYSSNHSRDSGISNFDSPKTDQSKAFREHINQSDCGYVSPMDQSEDHAPHCGYSEYMKSCGSVISGGSAMSGVSGTTIPSDQLPKGLQTVKEVEIAAIDSEVLDIQSRLLFAGNVKSFKIASATRHMIYAGDVFYLISDEWCKVYMVLLSDLLLITRVEKDNYITVLEEPIVLQDVIGAQWKCNHASEFQLSLECNECNNEGSHECHTTLTFRASTMESKHTWRNIVEQRIEACRSQNDRDRQLGRVVGHFI